MKLTHAPRSALTLSVLAIAVAGCASKHSQPVISQSVAAPPKHLLTASDIARMPADSPERAFLRHWSSLQNQSWDAAVSDYERQLLEDALSRNRFNQRATAAALNLSYDQLRHALKRHKLQDSAGQ